MLGIFSIPKAFKGHIGLIQRNAIQSWTLLKPRPEIILFGEDEGTAEAAETFGVRHIPAIARNEYGTPRMDDMFRQAERELRTKLMCYVNADIVLTCDMTRAVGEVESKVEKFLVVAQRINLDITEPLDFAGEWETRLTELRKREGVGGGPTAIDIFVFPKGTYKQVPDFGLGRLWFDQWLIKDVRKSGTAVIDVSRVAQLVHQNHDYNHVPGGAEWVWKGKEAEHNLKLYGEKPHTYTLLEVTHELLEDGNLRRVRLRRERAMLERFLWKTCIAPTAGVRRKLGLRRNRKTSATP